MYNDWVVLPGPLDGLTVLEGPDSATGQIMISSLIRRWEATQTGLLERMHGPFVCGLGLVFPALVILQPRHPRAWAQG